MRQLIKKFHDDDDDDNDDGVDNDHNNDHECREYDDNMNKSRCRVDLMMVMMIMMMMMITMETANCDHGDNHYDVEDITFDMY